MKQTKVTINGETWIVKVVTEHDMSKRQSDNEEPAAGLCEPDTREIIISEGYVNYAVIAHEIFHAYFSDLHLVDTNNIGLHDAEEITANLFAAKGERMARQARRILKELSDEA